MKILVVGGTGHIGSYLIPRLVQAGHNVLVVARTPEPRYAEARLCWSAVGWITADRRQEEQTDAWYRRMQGIEVDVVIDLICFTRTQNQTMMDAFRGRVRHFLHCGTIWAYGPAERAPYQEHYPRKPITEYGRQKADIESDLHAAFQESGFPATVIHPGHISGKRWLPIDPQGTRNGVSVYRQLARGESIQLPDNGLATLHHVHADDVAQLFQLAVERRQRALGESFSAVAPYAMSLTGCSRCVAGLFGQSPKWEFVPLARMKEFVGEAAFITIRDHVMHSPCASIAKGQRLLGYVPRYTTEQVYVESIEHLLETGQLEL